MRQPGLYWESLGGNNEENIGGNSHRYDVVTQGPSGPERKTFLVDAGSRFLNDDPNHEMAIPDFDRHLSRRGQPPADGPAAEALIVTHGHMDHLGAIPHLIKQGYDVPPVYTTPFTAKVMEKTLTDAKVKPAKWPTINTVTPGDKISVAGAEVTFVPVDHMPDATALHIKTKDASVFHTGDYKFDKTLSFGERSSLDQWTSIGDKGVDAMLADSTSISSKASDKAPPTEAEVGANLAAMVKENKGRRIVAAVLGTQMDRVAELVKAANAEGRTVVLTGASLVNNWSNLKAAGHDPAKVLGGKPDVIDGRAAAKRDLDPAKTMIITTGAFAQDGAGLTRMAAGEHRDVTMDANTTVLIPQRSIPPVRFAMGKMVKDLEAQGATVVTAERAEREGRPIHRSGHASREELSQALAALRPKTHIPIHGNAQQIETHAEVARDLGVKSEAVPRNGVTLRFADGKTSTVTERPPAEVMVHNTSGDWRRPWYEYTKSGAAGQDTAKTATAEETRARMAQRQTASR